MANNYTTLSSLFSAIASSIRGKTGETGALIADNFPTEISNISTKSDIYDTVKTEVITGRTVNLTDVMVLSVIAQAATSQTPAIVSLPTTATGSKNYTSDSFNLTITRESVTGTAPNLASRTYITYAEL